MEQKTSFAAIPSVQVAALLLEILSFIIMLKNLLKNRTALILSGLILMIVLASAGAFWFLNTQGTTGTVAEIYQNGELIKTIHLDTVTQDYSFTVEGENGIYNVIEVHHGEIGISEASCPDGLCVNMGFIHSSAFPVTCLPNKLVIKIVNETNSVEETNQLDIMAY